MGGIKCCVQMIIIHSKCKIAFMAYINWGFPMLCKVAKHLDKNAMNLYKHVECIFNHCVIENTLSCIK